MDDETPGWDAIDDALRGIYGDAKPYHLGTLLKWALGGPDPLDGISVYARTEPIPHWHFVSYGMSELYTKESENPDESGWGFEFTFRLARDPAEETPPAWAANFLQNLGRYVFTSGNWFEPGHHMDVNGPIAADRDDSEIRAVTFAADPELGEIATPHGSVLFLQVVGLAAEEYEALRRWNADGLMAVLAPHLPLLVTDVDRRSLLADPGVARAVEAGIARDGSSSGLLFVTTAGWLRDAGSTTLRLGALQAPAIADALRGRLPFGRELILQTEDTVLAFRPGDAFAVEEPDEGQLEVHVPPAALDDLTAVLRPTAGSAAVPALPGLTVEIVPTAMRDRYGNETGEVVG
ncbi:MULTISPECIES: suppressor of fused domain protein [Actinomadura]|uniref:Suppressor of fused protein (SUFU) n=1 Tax=Actinomadura madurae TaxID=1993 RepID=A0A1I5LYI1_9ACTN|nr:suppressor of fused domain protein [Actinomadura madurae]MCP9951624.1 suppressor of fused domain protein [Actinomadura madurae]MCP9980868.1 suppressor of fused domain protein [Actinomadura madurae]SFP02408.1 Suppressor of fused protein (SUFU) [Actinomadura madurae]